MYESYRSDLSFVWLTYVYGEISPMKFALYETLNVIGCKNCIFIMTRFVPQEEEDNVCYFA